MSKNKKIKYEPIREDDTLNLVTAICQAASLLDQVAKKAIINGDDETMIKVADRWIAIGNMFSVPEGDESDDHMDISDSVEPYGFTYKEPERDVVIDDDDDEPEGTDSRSQVKV